MDHGFPKSKVGCLPLWFAMKATANPRGGDESVRALDGNWTGIVGGTNIGKATATLRESGGTLSGQVTFDDLFAVPLRVNAHGALSGRWLEASLSGFGAAAQPPGTRAPQSGRILGLVEEDGDKITGFWMTDIGTTGSFILVRAS